MQHSMIRSRIFATIFTCSVLPVLIALAGTDVRSQSPAQKSQPSRMAPPSAGFISGTVLSARGPEAGVWVIAETGDLATKFRKIVVTDEQGRYLIPDLPKAKYKVWVRGYGLVDSVPVPGAPGDTLSLTATAAPTPQAAAQYYPADYWYSLLNVPSKAGFPMINSNPASASGGFVSVDVSSRPPDLAAGGASIIKAQAQYVWGIKRGCEVCHQMGEKDTREVPASFGTFNTSKDAWARLLRSGQIGDEHIDALKSFGYDRGLTMLRDWSDG